MLSVDEARQRIVSSLAPVGVEVVSVAAAHGRSLAQPMVARRTQPPSDLSAMDGYALCLGGTTPSPPALTVIGEAAAGRPFAGRVGPGEAVRISTGAALPAGADTVVLQEDCARQGDRVVLTEAAQFGRHIRRQGGDFAEGDSGPPVPRRLAPRDLALAAAMNIPWLTVRRRPRIALLATGDELARPGEAIPPGGIIASSSIAVAALIERWGGVPIDLGIAPDRIEAIRERAQGAAGADLLVTFGGASVGDHDLVAKALAGDHGSLDFWKVAMRPGKPLMFGRHGAVPLLGVPGNPVSAHVCALLFLGPALARLLGLDPGPPATRRALAGCALAANDRRRDHLRSRLSTDATGALVATPQPVQDSGQVAPLAHADALLVREPGAPAAAAGSAVEIIDLEGC